jgi:hypothetical protein
VGQGKKSNYIFADAAGTMDMFCHLRVWRKTLPIRSAEFLIAPSRLF